MSDVGSCCSYCKRFHGCRLALAISSCDVVETEDKTYQGREAQVAPVSCERASPQRSDVGNKPLGQFLRQ